MKLLLDENIIPLVIEKIKERYPGSVDIYDIGYAGKSDNDIYDFLVRNGKKLAWHLFRSDEL